jgi:beta-catenin-like protein 1
MPPQLLVELTDPDVFAESSAALVVVEALLQGPLLSLLLENVARLREDNDDEFRGVHSTLTVVAHVLEVRDVMCAHAKLPYSPVHYNS